MRNSNVSLSDFENDLQVNLRTDRAREWIFRAFRGKILKMHLLDLQPWWCLHGKIVL